MPERGADDRARIAESRHDPDASSPLRTGSPACSSEPAAFSAISIWASRQRALLQRPVLFLASCSPRCPRSTCARLGASDRGACDPFRTAAGRAAALLVALWTRAPLLGLSPAAEQAAAHSHGALRVCVVARSRARCDRSGARAAARSAGDARSRSIQPQHRPRTRRRRADARQSCKWPKSACATTIGSARVAFAAEAAIEDLLGPRTGCPPRKKPRSVVTAPTSVPRSAARRRRCRRFGGAHRAPQRRRQPGAIRSTRQRRRVAAGVPVDVGAARSSCASRTCAWSPCACRRGPTKGKRSRLRIVTASGAPARESRSGSTATAS